MSVMTTEMLGDPSFWAVSRIAVAEPQWLELRSSKAEIISVTRPVNVMHVGPRGIRITLRAKKWSCIRSVTLILTTENGDRIQHQRDLSDINLGRKESYTFLIERSQFAPEVSWGRLTGVRLDVEFTGPTRLWLVRLEPEMSDDTFTIPLPDKWREINGVSFDVNIDDGFKHDYYRVKMPLKDIPAQKETITFHIKTPDGED
jgi:hypothetical protein